MLHAIHEVLKHPVFVEKLVSTGIDGFLFRPVIAGNHDDGERHVASAHLLDEVGAGHRAHGVIGDHHIGPGIQNVTEGIFGC